MKLILFILCLPLIASAARRYDLNVNYSVEEGQNVKNHLIVKEGKKTLIVGKDHYMEVIAEEGEVMKRKGILLSFNVGEVDKNGKRSIITQPKLLVKENQEAQITIDDVALTVTAIRK